MRAGVGFTHSLPHVAFSLGMAVATACGTAATDAPPEAGAGPKDAGALHAEAGKGQHGKGAQPPVSDAGPDATVTGDASADLDGNPGPSFPDGGCPATSLAAGDYAQTVGTDGGVRTYQVHVPPGLSSSVPAPLVLVFHGGGQTSAQFEGFAHVQPKSDASGFVLVEAEGTPALPGLEAGVLDVWNAGNCCELAAQVNDNVDDVGFVAAMLDAVESRICIDPKRVFATGFSNGGMLSHRLACEMSDRIAAIAAVSGGLGNRNLDVTPVKTLFPCTPARPVPVLHIHGTRDACYPFDGGLGPLSFCTFEPVLTTIQGWVARNGCSAMPTTVRTNGAATCQLYPCPHAGDVELCTIDGGGHYWPGGGDWAGSEIFCGLGQGVRSADLVANDALWSWFTAHPMP
jgi:polyhydroxybutyrate depolymerase